MIIKQAEPSAIPQIIREHLTKKLEGTEFPLFVFSSDVAVDTWTEWAARNPEESGVRAVALEDFTAWDKFKGTYLAGDVSGKKCIPSLLRKLFIRSLIHQNLQFHFIKKIIPSDSGESAYAFTDWLAKILPALNLWHKKYEEFLLKNGLTATSDPDLENRDYYEIFTRYNDFLEKNAFFEPSWLTPEFVEKERTVIIFYPEILEDFSEYEDVFSSVQNVIAVRMPDEKPLISAYKYPDSRMELRHAILRLRELHEQGIKWTEMALSVPDLEVYRPYIRREFELYCIPFNIRAGESLTNNCAGQIFNQINDCVKSNFSYNSVRALLQNEYVPWKSDVRELKENLIREGNRLRAICAYEKDENSFELVDSWVEALSAAPGDVRELEFYKSLKNEVKKICQAASFEAVRTAWLIFRQNFLEVENFSGDANRILGRCISELDDLIDIEKRYLVPLALIAENPYSFYLNELNSKSYRPQEELNGVSIFSYRLSAQARFKVQLVIDSSQKNLDVPYKKLGFLNTEKRKLLLGADVDENANASVAFIRLYAAGSENSVLPVRFSYAEESFAGFSIAHNAFAVVDVEKLPPQELARLEEKDFIKNERDRISKAQFNFPQNQVLTKAQKASFERWVELTKNFNDIQREIPSEILQEKIKAALVTHRKSEADIVVTQSDLSKFYPCPRKWLLNTVLHLKEESLDTNLMQNFDMGNINHKILELFMNDLISMDECLPATDENGLFANEEQINQKIMEFTKEAIHSSQMDFCYSLLVLQTLDSQASLIAEGIMNFLHFLCKAPDKPDPDKLNTKTSIKGFGGYKVVGAELKISSVMQAGEEKNPIHLFGIIDCLLCSDEGDYVIIDYKNSKNSVPAASEINGDEYGILGDFQMPMYITLVKNEKILTTLTDESKIKVEAAYFYAIKNCDRTLALDEFRGLKKDAPPDAANLSKYDDFCRITLPLFNNYAQDFVDRVKESRFEPVNPSEVYGNYVHVEPHKVCAACDFKSICRTTFTVGEKELSREF